MAIHPNYQDRVVLLQQDNRVAIETFEEVRWLWLACVGRYEGALLAQVFACMGWLASHLAAWFRSCQAVQTSLACRLTTGAPRLLPSEMQVMQLAVAGCRAVAEFMRQRLLEHTEVGWNAF